MLLAVCLFHVVNGALIVYANKLRVRDRVIEFVSIVPGTTLISYVSTTDSDKSVAAAAAQHERYTISHLTKFQ